MDWIKSISRPLDFEKVQLEMFQIAKTTPRAGDWLLSSPEFKKWRNGELRRLWCHGNPGTGKTVLASIVIDYLRSKFSCNDKTACIYVYFDYRRQQYQGLGNILASLLLQLLQVRDVVSSDVQKLHTAWKKTGVSPCEEDYVKMLKSQMAAFDEVYMVVDALDECSDDVQTNTLSNFLSDCKKLPQNVHILFTSRKFTKFSGLIEPSDDLEIIAHDSDIKAYLNKFIDSRTRLHRLIENGPQTKSSFRDKVISTIVEKSQGMFLLAHLHIESLALAHDLAGLKDGLEKLPTKLDEFYTEALRRIGTQAEPDRDRAFNVLTWLVFSQRPLEVEELTHALTIRDASAYFKSGKRTLPKASETLGSEEALTSACAGLVVVVSGGNNKKIVRLAHTTAEKYLQDKRPDFLLHNAQSMMANTCLYCLLMIPTKKLSASQDELKENHKDYPFLRYAANYWGTHLFESSAPPGELYKLAWAVVSNKPKLNATLRIMADPFLSYETNVSDLHIAAYYGLVELVAKAMTKHKDIDINAQTKRQETPLHWATAHRQWDFMAFLIDRGADLNMPNADKRTALHRAVMMDDKVAVEILLSSKRVNLELQDCAGYTCLRWAAKYGQVDMVNMLLKAKAEVDAHDEHGYTALRWAAHEGDRAIIKTLVRHKASLEAQNGGDNWTLLRWAAQDGQDEIIRFLAKRKIDLNVTDDEGRTALRWAVDYHRAKAAWMLIQCRADVGKPDNEGKQPLHAVVENCCTSSDSNSKKSFLNILWLLLQSRVDVNARTRNPCLTPLHMAASGGCNPAVWVLLENGADPRRVDANERTALHYAVGGGHLETCQALIGKADDLIRAVDHERRTALHWAVSTSNLQLVQMLLGHQAPVDAQDSNGQTPLHIAASLDHALIVQTLLDHGARINVQDGEGKTPLHLAAALGSAVVIEELLDHGVPIDLRDNKTQTPLHLAILQQREDIVDCLVARGADLQFRNAERLTAVDLAISSGNTRIVELIHQAAGLGMRLRREENMPHEEPTVQRTWDRRFAASVEDE
nr:NACHT and ankyrin domain protein [Colletotrichum truncatum]KAF6795218.1 NACHT and ankyrin domain protein [Colletotrichum truncatum]